MQVRMKRIRNTAPYLSVEDVDAAPAIPVRIWTALSVTQIYSAAPMQMFQVPR